MLEVEEVPVPRVKSGHMLVRTDLSGICGTDVSMIKHDMAQPDTILGHEPIGTIAEVGPGVSGWTVGERVIVETRPSCGRCAYCSAGMTHLCERMSGELGGGFAEYMVAADNLLKRFPESVPPERAVLWNPLANATHAWKLARFRKGCVVLIMGVGPIGLFVLRAAKRAGAGAVVVSDPAASRRAMAMRFGADEALDPMTCDVGAEMRKHAETGPDIVFECAGKEETLQEAATCVKRGGQIVLFGISMKPVTIIPMLWVLKEIDVQAGFGYVDADMNDTLDLFANDTIAHEQMITSTITLEEAPEMFQKLVRSEEEIKVVISFNG
jgi:2-desacetyl-2-hydroxyethyl bacteriochlorophyllide A dehydrogenase